jgi:hypothetical protein
VAVTVAVLVISVVTVSVAVAGGATGRPPTNSWLVVLGNSPAKLIPGNEAGTCKGILNVHVPPGKRLPPVRLRNDVPAIVDPAPHGVGGRPVATSPESVSFRLSVKERLLTVSVELRFSIVNVRETVPPISAVAPNDFVRLTNRTRNVSMAGSDVAASPPTVPVAALVTLV